MSTVSANASVSPDRRHFLSTLAGVGAVGLPALPKLATAPGPVEAMYPDFLRLAKAHDAAAEATWDAEERYTEPSRPLWHPALSEGGYKLEKLPDNKCRCYLNDSDENIARLKAILAAPYVPDPSQAVTKRSYRDRIERTLKTLDAIKTWKAEDQRRRDAAGLTASEDAEERARSANAEIRDAILAIKAATYRELAFQAAVVNVEWSAGRAEVIVGRLVELAGIESYAAT